MVDLAVKTSSECTAHRYIWPESQYLSGGIVSKENGNDWKAG